MLTLLATSLAIGFLGSFHCVGMCGGLVTTMTMARPKIWWPGLIMYQVGRIITYSFLGILTGMIGIAISKVPWFANIQLTLTVVAGIMMILFGLHIGGWLSDPFRRISSGFMKISGFSNWLRSAATSSHPMSWMIVGLLNGLLPCGLVYAALMQSLAVGSVPVAGLAMVSFGLGTVPAMTLVPVVLRKASPLLRARVLKFAALLLIALGLLTIFRGTDWLHGRHDNGHGSGHTMHSGATQTPIRLFSAS